MPALQSGKCRLSGPAADGERVLDGWEATRRIKAANPAIPIIALTAHAMDGDKMKAKAAGCDDYDTKPVELPRLLGKMEALLNA